MIKDLFPLKTFQQDAVLARLNEIAEKAASVKEIEDGDLDNAKPIYYHPITIRNTNYGYLSFHILDNNGNAYTKETLVTKIADFDRIAPLSGAIKKEVDGVITTLIVAYAYKQGDIHLCLGLTTEGVAVDGASGYVTIQDLLTGLATTVSDGVNKIN